MCASVLTMSVFDFIKIRLNINKFEDCFMTIEPPDLQKLTTCELIFFKNLIFYVLLTFVSNGIVSCQKIKDLYK